ncbi:MAG: mandelate racemase/muconate lactonizing enzyme family protein [Armatimonadetes bacterium]|nr:mandelate racemase/muconate lactonizing enzyme family protein [Armatimonadota bacterium]
MRITRVTTAVVEANYDWTFVRIETDTGLTGLGECFFAPGLTAMIRDLRNVLIGQDPRHVDRLVRKLQRAASGAGSVSGIVYNAITGMEGALLDLVGRACGVPIWQLLGGKFRDEVRIYADCHAGVGLESVGPSLEHREPAWFQAVRAGLTEEHLHEPEASARRARQAVENGFDALKFDLDLDVESQEGQLRALTTDEIQLMAARMAAIRAAVGPGVDVALDCHWRYPLADVIRIAAALEPYGIFWLEDPVPPFNPRSFLTLRESTRVPLCTGENLFTRHGFRELIETQAVHFLSPDLQKMGGLLEGRRVADHAEMYDLLIAPHCIAGPIGLLASCHLCCAIPNFAVLEFHGQDVPFWDEILTGLPRPLIQGGRVRVPDTPGLGAELNEPVARGYGKPGEGWFTE